MLQKLYENLLDIFRRNSGRYPTLDGLRAIAALQVLVFHGFYLNYTSIGAQKSGELMVFMSPWLNWVWQGDKGVDLFFVLSGFLISMLLLREHQRTGSVRIGRFFRRRTARILPAYLVLLAYAWWIGMPNREWVWGNLFFISNLLPAGTLFIPWSWTITVEAQFYLLFPLLVLPLLLRARHPLTLALLLVVLVFALRLLAIAAHPELVEQPFYQLMFAGEGMGGWMETVYIHLYTRAGPLMLGITAGVLHVYYAGSLDRFGARYPGAVSVLAVIALILLAVSVSVPYHNAQAGYFRSVGVTGQLWIMGLHRNLFALAVATLLLFSLHPAGSMRPIASFLASRWLTPVAKVSYSLYLFHIFVLQVVFRSLRDWWPEAVGSFGWLAVGTLLTALAAFLLSAVIYVLVEKPFNDLGHRGSQSR